MRIFASSMPNLETFSKRQEQTLSKKESQGDVMEMRGGQDAIFNLSRTRGSVGC
jgi:hypothetical protein